MLALVMDSSTSREQFWVSAICEFEMEGAISSLARLMGVLSCCRWIGSLVFAVDPFWYQVVILFPQVGRGGFSSFFSPEFWYCFQSGYCVS